MKKYKAVFFDWDGTAVTSRTAPAEAAVSAMRPLLEKAGRKRGFLVRGGGVDTERMARILLDEFRGGKLGRFTLELPPAGP